MDASVEVTTVSVTGFPLMIVNPVNERAILVSSVGTNFNNTLLDSQLTVDGLDIIVNNEEIDFIQILQGSSNKILYLNILI